MAHVSGHEVHAHLTKAAKALRKHRDATMSLKQETAARVEAERARNTQEVDTANPRKETSG